MDCSVKSGWCISTTGINHPEKNRDNAFQDTFEDTFKEAFEDALMDAFEDILQDSCEEGFEDAFEDPFEDPFDDDLIDEGDDAFDVDDLMMVVPILNNAKIRSNLVSSAQANGTSETMSPGDQLKEGHHGRIEVGGLISLSGRLVDWFVALAGVYASDPHQTQGTPPSVPSSITPLTRNRPMLRRYNGFWPFRGNAAQRL